MTSDDVSRVDLIVQHIVKNKKLQLPKTYLRNPKSYQAEYADMEDVLEPESVQDVASLAVSVPSSSASVFEPNVEVQNEKVGVERKQRAKSAKSSKTGQVVKELESNKSEQPAKEKRPTAYNVFVKDAVRKLQDSHQHLSSKERFQLAIQMWNDHKKKTTTAEYAPMT